jgi:hypothetical protein
MVVCCTTRCMACDQQLTNIDGEAGPVVPTPGFPVNNVTMDYGRANGINPDMHQGPRLMPRPQTAARVEPLRQQAGMLCMRLLVRFPSSTSLLCQATIPAKICRVQSPAWRTGDLKAGMRMRKGGRQYLCLGLMLGLAFRLGDGAAGQAQPTLDHEDRMSLRSKLQILYLRSTVQFDGNSNSAGRSTRLGICVVEVGVGSATYTT